MMNIDLMILQAMKDKQEGKVRTYRAIKSEIQAFKTAKNAKIYDEVAEITLLKRMIKQREDSIQQYTNAGRKDLADSENIEVLYLKELIPEEPTKEDILDWLEDKGFTKISRNEMGSTIKMVKSAFPAVNGKMVSEIVKSMIV
jgi:uncharacterized protein YqeY